MNNIRAAVVAVISVSADICLVSGITDHVGFFCSKDDSTIAAFTVPSDELTDQ